MIPTSFRKRRRVGAVVLASLGLCALLPAGGAQALTAPTDTHLRFWASTNGGTSAQQVYTRTEAVAVATRYDVVVATKHAFRDHVDAMKVANPELSIIAYMNGAFSKDTEDGAFPADWYVRDGAGNKVRSSQWGNFLMDPVKPGWRDFVVSRCTQWLTISAGYDGCYLDDLGAGNLISTGNLSARPVNPRTRSAYTQNEWLRDTSGLAAHVTTKLDRKMILANGLNSGANYFEPTIDARRLITATDGANAEGWLRGAHTGLEDFRPEARWKQDVDLLVDAGQQGKSVIAMTKIWRSATAAQVERWRRYSYASFLLGTNGRQYLYFNPAGPGKPPAAHPLDTVLTGQPVSGYVKSGGVYQRRFERATVLVNPTATTVTVDLGRLHRKLDGGISTKVTLAPHTGEIAVPQ